MFFSFKGYHRNSEILDGIKEASERQGVVPLQLLFSPYLAAGLPAVGAASIAIYGSYGDEIRRLYNSIFRKLKCLMFKILLL